MLNSNAILCPKLIDVVSDDDKSFILMEVIDGESASESVLDVKTSEIILDTIQSHELVLGNNLETLQLVDENLNLDKEIDYEKNY